LLEVVSLAPLVVGLLEEEGLKIDHGIILVEILLHLSGEATCLGQLTLFGPQPPFETIVSLEELKYVVPGMVGVVIVRDVVLL
jgi:hypothetical protein